MIKDFFLKFKDCNSFVGKQKAIKNTMRFSHLFILQFISWFRDLGTINYDSETNL